MTLESLCINFWHRADATPLDDGSTGSALSDTKGLGQVALAIKFNSDATGVLKVIPGGEPSLKEGGKISTIDSAEYTKGIWHLVEIRHVLAANTTVAAGKFELGYRRR